eukprot:CAMPEP_0175080604 /NCGR_PEP_ID=MMETSP0052_2-20121109/25611_1 /TAXON_ID=51329 ORGANISM="Polytomella parva, Strain SAG 63-3" /NCGR_SAMPLE_ID=MMETSP0052_2 /ASSEMBLY_ACC=CAM_ASM_000194 /LENGTH=272 /DNA_ID=CAMNT_0016351345 /DNA_START=1177 /DNA_END=1996 /DNA_ORIENTATION=+
MRLFPSPSSLRYSIKDYGGRDSRDINYRDPGDLRGGRGYEDDRYDYRGRYNGTSDNRFDYRGDYGNRERYDDRAGFDYPRGGRDRDVRGYDYRPLSRAADPPRGFGDYANEPRGRGDYGGEREGGGGGGWGRRYGDSYGTERRLYRRSSPPRSERRDDRHGGDINPGYSRRTSSIHQQERRTSPEYSRDATDRRTARDEEEDREKGTSVTHLRSPKEVNRMEGSGQGNPERAGQPKNMVPEDEREFGVMREGGGELYMNLDPDADLEQAIMD